MPFSEVPLPKHSISGVGLLHPFLNQSKMISWPNPPLLRFQQRHHILSWAEPISCQQWLSQIQITFCFFLQASSTPWLTDSGGNENWNLLMRVLTVGSGKGGVWMCLLAFPLQKVFLWLYQKYSKALVASHIITDTIAEITTSWLGQGFL